MAAPACSTATTAPIRPHDQQLFNGQKVIANSYVHHGQPGFILDPTRGVTADDVLRGTGRLSRRRASTSSALDFQMPYTWQTILGFQKQLGGSDRLSMPT